MINKHPSDSELQQYAVQPISCNIELLEHLAYCKDCNSMVMQYQKLFAEINQMEKPAFDFNLSGLVLAQLPIQNAVVKKTITVPAFIAILILTFMSAIIYFFGNYLTSIFIGITPIITSLIIITVIGILICQCIDLNQKYQAQLKILNSF